MLHCLQLGLFQNIQVTQFERGMIMVQEINLERGKARRCMLAMWVDVQEAHGSVPNADLLLNSAIWEPLGIGTEDASITYEYDESTTTDIWNITETLVSNVNQSITFDPYYIRAGDSLQSILLDKVNRGAWDELSLFRVMVARYYVGDDEQWQAEVHHGCTIKVISEGGSSYVSMPIDLTFGGHKLMGQVKVKPPEIPTFYAV